MRYAIISNKDTNTSFEIFRSKNIASENVVHINFLPNLMRSLHVGDEVLVISSDRFNTVRQLSCFGKYCMENKVIFSVLAQPYLNIGKGKVWKTSTIRLLVELAQIESYAVGEMTKNFKMTNEQWDYVFRCFQVQTVESVARIFAQDGILSRKG